uniref:Integrase catalytic domain-containing protein n=1 Tax=Haemonchus contortus TaxID=6289 RepID=A0A7I4YFQ0_HAECO
MCEMPPESETHSFNTLSNFDDELERWDKYWTLDSAGICEFTGTKCNEKEATNEKVAKFFEDTIQRRKDGYYVRLPYKENHPPLPSNRAIAQKRLHSVIHLLNKTPLLLRDYDRTFVEQEDKGIIETVPDPAVKTGPVLHYIPHQPVITPHKQTTKLRIVFDASAHFRDNPSLNDILHQGSLILPELYAMLLRFRISKYVAIADVEKAFLQVHLHKLDRDATRFLWVKQLDAAITEDNIKVLRFTRVTFGLNVSPYLLGGTIQHHLRNAVLDSALADEIQENLYVDNLILSAETEEELIAKSVNARKIFTEMGMNLREFLSNNKNLKNALPEETSAKSNTQKVLGIVWNSELDELNISCKIASSENLTKRFVARQIASIFDLLGWLVPLLITAKKFQQDLWKQKFQWDTVLPRELGERWQDIVQNINGFQRALPRRSYINPEKLSLAVFADASEVAIAACAYLFNTTNSALIMGRGKLSSIKTKTTIPKLELNALTMAARLALSITRAMKSRIPDYPWTIYLFSDSQIALSWLSSSRKTYLGVLVENRIREIRNIVHCLNDEKVTVNFCYINTTENPADAGTRGLSKNEMEAHTWWTGPSFLSQPLETWETTFYPLPTEKPSSANSDSPEDITIINNTLAERIIVHELLDWSHTKSLSSGKRIVVLLLRFIKKLLRHMDENAKQRIFTNIPELRKIGEDCNTPNGQDIRAARSAIIRNHQTLYLTKEYRKSMENTLRLFKDCDHLWRSRGRLGNANLNNNTKSPIFITPNTILARLLIEEAHGTYHQGTEHTIATIRQNYWIPKLRQQVRKLISHCVKCRRFNALPYHYPEMTDLPSRRVQRYRPFQHIGLDFFDLPPCAENDCTIKLYGCIFTCTVTRLIHLEVVRSMATQEFINALRRFVARRGVPETITCDNAPTFLLSANILKNQPLSLQRDILRSVTDREIQWKRITPYASWQGGFYERLIKSIKHALYKALRGNNRRSFDDIITFVTEVEACLNSRPLTYQGSELEFSSIRPAGFIHHDIVLTLEPTEEMAIDENDPITFPLNKRKHFSIDTKSYRHFDPHMKR